MYNNPPKSSQRNAFCVILIFLKPLSCFNLSGYRQGCVAALSRRCCIIPDSSDFFPAIPISNDEFYKRIKDFEKEFERVLCVRVIGIQADMAALKRVFPAATKKPYFFRSFVDLHNFIDDPKIATDEYLCPKEAAAAWEAMDKNERDLIVQKRNELIEQFPYLPFSINTLKDDWDAARRFKTVDDCIWHFFHSDDEGMVDAIELCVRILTESYFR